MKPAMATDNNSPMEAQPIDTRSDVARTGGMLPEPRNERNTLDELLVDRELPHKAEVTMKDDHGTGLRQIDPKSLRLERGVTLTALAAGAGAHISSLSVFENHSKDHLLSLVRRYIRGLGGEVEVHAVFGGERVKLVFPRLEGSDEDVAA